MTERAITKRAIDRLRARGAWVYKTHGGAGTRAGVPDLLVGYRGRLLAMEAKRPGEKPTRLQAREIGAIQASGCAGIVIHSAEDALAALDAIDAQDPPPC